MSNEGGKQEEPVKKPDFNFPASFKKRFWWYLVLIVAAFDWMAWLEIKSGRFQNYPEYAIFAFSGLIYVILMYSYFTKIDKPMHLTQPARYLISLSLLAMVAITIISWLVRNSLV